MQTIRVQTTQNVFIHYPLASAGDRILAYLIDSLILVLYIIGIIAIGISADIEIWWLYGVAIGMPYLLYHVLFEIFMNGQTPGKRAMKIKVVRLDGTSPAIGDYLLRWLFAIVDFHILSGAIALIVISAGGKGQRVGDIVAGTCVVKLTSHQQISASDVFVTAEQTYTPTYTQVVMLTDNDIEVIQQALEVYRTQANTQPVMAVAEKIKSMLGIQTDLQPVQFLNVILKDFNHITSH